VYVFIAPRVTWTGVLRKLGDTIYGAKLAKLDYDAAYSRLKGSAGNLRCSDVRDILKDLGFTVRDGKKGGHKTFRHSSIPNFFGGNFDCGHGRDSEVLKIYIANIIVVLEKYENEIKSYIQKNKN